MRAEMDYYTIYVYSPAMIALEKLRAICQQIQSTVSGPIEDFDYYFDFVLQAVDLLHPPGME